MAALVLLAHGCECPPGTRTRAQKANAGALGERPTEVRVKVTRKSIPVRPPMAITPPPDPAVRVAEELSRMAPSDPHRVETVVITYRDPVAVLRDSVWSYVGAPHAEHKDSLTGPAAAQRLKDRRAAELLQFADSLEDQHGAVVLPQRFSFAHALVVQMKLSEIMQVATDPRVVRIDPLWGDGPPQDDPISCGDPDDKLKIFRSALRCEPYLAAGFGEGTIHLLDTGVDTRHMLLSSGQVLVARDCVTDPSQCQPGDGLLDVSMPGGHGTASAAMLSGREPEESASSAENQGMTEADIESYRVFGIPPGSLTAKVNYDGAAQALDEIVGGEPEIVVVEVATGLGGYGALTQQAGWAFDRGAVVIAANGNSDSRELYQPANSPRALGVGMYCINTPEVFRADATWGITPDQRIKPDLGAVTGAYTASSNETNFSKLATFPGTSGAAPVVGAAALLLRNWMASGGGIVVPGEVYAMLLMCGNQRLVNTTEGAGRIGLPSSGYVWWGAVEVGSGEQFTLQFDAGTLEASGLEAAIWWPEYGVGGGVIPAVSERAWIGLRAIDPSGQSSDPSEQVESVFQRISMSSSGSSSSRLWKIQIEGNFVPGTTRDVYYAVWAKP